jgi:hypothetical protein
MPSFLVVKLEVTIQSVFHLRHGRIGFKIKVLVLWKQYRIECAYEMFKEYK